MLIKLHTSIVLINKSAATQGNSASMKTYRWPEPAVGTAPSVLLMFDKSSTAEQVSLPECPSFGLYGETLLLIKKIKQIQIMHRHNT